MTGPSRARRARGLTGRTFHDMRFSADAAAQPSATDLVVLQDVRVQRGKKFALDIPLFRVPAGSVVGVIGNNGAGKSTLLQLLPGLLMADSGTVRVLGMDPAQQGAEVRAQLGYMTDDMPIFDMRIHALLRMISGYYETWDPKLVERLLDRFALDPTRKVRELSKGEGTRIRLLLAAAFRPKVMVLDEPATGLDIDGRRAVLEVVLETVKEEDRSVVVSSHNLVDLERSADWLLVLDKGQVVKQGPAAQLIGDKRSLEEAILSWTSEKSA